MIKTEELIIDRTKYTLKDTQYYQKSFKKKQIVVGHTFTDNMSHIIGWKNRYNGKYKKNSAFTIDKDGIIYQHFDPEYYSNFLSLKDIDEFIIGVSLVNSGWLMRNLSTDEYFDYLGRPYTNEDIIKKRWRGKTYWASYTDEQINALIELCKYLSNEYGVELRTIGHNTRTDGVYDFNGIVFKSNYIKEYTDLSPAFDYVDFKNKLELKFNTDEE